MKKYLIKGLLALVVGGFTASCADKDGDYVPVGQQKATAYADAFKELIGGEVAPNHDWGFTKTSLVDETASTRVAETNANEWFSGTNPKFSGLVEPAPITDREEEVVTKWFKDNRYPSSDPISLSTFFVQQVHYGTQVYTAVGDNNTTYEVTGGNHMDWLCAYSNTERNVTSWSPYTEEAVSVAGHDDHINNFNTSAPERSGIQLMMYSSTSRFGFSESYNTNPVREGDAVSSENKRLYYNYVLKAIQVDGVWGYYVGFDYESHGDRGDYDPNGYYDDRIVKIVPGDGVITFTPGGGSSSSSTSTRTDRIERRRLVSQGRIFCEDLGTDAARMTKSDIDFNDAVFDAKIWRLGQYDVTYVNGNYSSETDYLEGIYDNGLENGKFKYIAEIRLLAAGGTVPLKIGGKYGFEIHAKFGEGNNRTIAHTTIINTMGAPSQANFSTTVSTETCDAVTVEVDITSLVAGKSEIGLDIIPIDVEWVSQTGQSVGELTADFGKAPQKLCVPIGTPWVYERIPITDAYKDFAAYATSRTPLFWDGTKNESLLYPSLPEGMTPETGETFNVNTNPYHDRVVTQGTTTTTTVTETVLWEGEFTAANASGGSNSEEFTLYSKDFAVGDKMRIYGEATGNDPWVSIHAVVNGSWKKYADCVITSPYTDIVVTQDMINEMTLKTALWGKFCKVTKICKVVTTTN
ncbi:MAG: hypothetical protein E7103_05710 [Prevotella sp.]|nr:hypothetical protein [Prevotella sp.]